MLKALRPKRYQFRTTKRTNKTKIIDDGSKSIVDDGYKRRKSVWETFANHFRGTTRTPGTLILVRHGKHL